MCSKFTKLILIAVVSILGVSIVACGDSSKMSVKNSSATIYSYSEWLDKERTHNSNLGKSLNLEELYRLESLYNRSNVVNTCKKVEEVPTCVIEVFNNDNVSYRIICGNRSVYDRTNTTSKEVQVLDNSDFLTWFTRLYSQYYPSVTPAKISKKTVKMPRTTTVHKRNNITKIKETPLDVVEEVEEKLTEELENNIPQEYSPEDLKVLGEIYSGNWKFTWYSENVLPGEGLNIPGRYSDGNFVRDENGFLCVASEDLPFGSTLDTPWGEAKVYDCGCDHGTIDIYVSW